jgi:hypothetical protein
MSAGPPRGDRDRPSRPMTTKARLRLKARKKQRKRRASSSCPRRAS